jgi:hypothetical protein
MSKSRTLMERSLQQWKVGDAEENGWDIEMVGENKESDNQDETGNKTKRIIP